MRLTDLIQGVRDLTEDRTKNHWGDAQITRLLHNEQLKIWRRLVDLDENYSNVRINLAKGTETSVRSDLQVFTMPSWVYKVLRVREGQPSENSEGQSLIKHHKHDDNRGWELGPHPELHLRHWSDVPSGGIDLEVAKIPARLTRGTLPDQTGMAANQMRLDLDPDISADPTALPHETETDAYAGALFEITGVDDVNRQPGGQIRRCTASAHRQVHSGALHTELTFREDFAVQPVSGDTYEMHQAEISDAHVRYLILLVAQAMFQQEGNVDQLRTIGIELSAESQNFTSHIQRREVVRPTLLRTDDDFSRESRVRPWLAGFDNGY